MPLPSERNTLTTRRKVIAAAKAKFGRVGLDPFFEHGHWWLRVDTPGGDNEQQYYSVVDTQDGFDFEQV